MSQLAEAYMTIRADQTGLSGQLASIKSMFQGTVANIASSIAIAGGSFQKLIDLAHGFALSIADEEEQLIRFKGAVQAAGRGDYFTDLVQRIGLASEATSAFSADAVRAAATAIAPFRTLGDETLGKLLNTARDLTAQFGGDLASNARRLGMALERPELAMRMLRSMSVILTAAQQQQVLGFVKLGDAASASALILEIAHSKAIGQAEKLGGTLKSLWTRIKIQLSEMSETMGAGMLEGLKSFGEASISVLKKFREMLETDTVIGRIARMAASFLGGAAAIGTLSRVITTVKSLLFGTLGPLGWIAAAVIAISTQFVSLTDIINWFSGVWEKIVTRLNISGVLDKLRMSFAMLGDRIMDTFSRILGSKEAWGDTFSSLGDWIAWAVEQFAQFLVKVVNFFIGMYDNAKLYWELLKITAGEMWIEVVDYMRNTFLPAVAGVWAGFVAIVKVAIEDAVAWVKYGSAQMGESISASLEKKVPWFVRRAPGVGLGISLGGWLLGAGKDGTPESPTRSIEDYKNAAINAFEEAQRTSKAGAEAGNAEDRKAAEALGARRKAILDDLAKEEAKQDQEAMDRLNDMWDAEEEEAAFWASWRGEPGKGPTAGIPGGKKGKEEELKISTGFVGVAEFAKQFQAAVLKGENELAKRTTKATEDTAANTKKIAEREPGSPWDEMP